MTYPTTSPELTLDFAKSEQLDPRVTFSRSSSATYVGYDGLIKTAPDDVARFEYDANGKCLGLLVEESRTNYLWKYANPNYNNRSAVYSTYSDSRFGADQSAHSWTFNSAASDTALGWFDPGNISTTGNGVQYTISFWAKANQAYLLKGNLIDERRSSVNLNFDLTTEWQYFTASTPAGVNDDGSGTVYFRWLKGSGATPIPAGLQLDFAAVNLEIGGFPTSFIPTAGATTTRAADLVSITGTNFSSWYNQGEGSIFLYLSGQTYTPANYKRLVTIADSSSDSMSAGNQISFGSHAGITTQRWFTRNGSSIAYIPLALNPPVAKTAIGFESPELPSVTYDGADIVTYNISNAIPITADRLSLFGTQTITRLAYYPERVSDESLEALTA